MLATTVSIGGASAGAALIGENTSRAFSEAGTVLYSGGYRAAEAASEYAYINGGTLGLPTRNVTIF